MISLTIKKQEYLNRCLKYRKNEQSANFLRREEPIQILRNIIRNIIKIIEEQYFSISKVYLRGSILSSNFSSDSDIDIIVVSDHFKGISISKRKMVFSKYLYPYKIDALCLTETEFSYFKNNIIKLGMERVKLIYG